MLTRVFRLTSVVVAVLAIGGCGALLGGVPAPGEMDVRTLDVGKYSTEPLDSYYEYTHSTSSGTSLAISRLADHVATGLDVDSSLRFGTGVQQIAKPTDVKAALTENSVEVAQRNNMLFGFVSGSSDTRPEFAVDLPPTATLITLAVMQFPDAGSADRAATEFERVDFEVADDQNEAVQITKYPSAHAHWRPGTPTIGATIAHGNYVVDVFASTSAPDVSQLSGLVEKAYSAQIPLLDSLAPLSAEQVLRLDNDPEGMLRRIIIPIRIGIPGVGSLATYQLRGFLHWQTDRAEAEKLYAARHVERIAFSDAYSPWTNTYSEGIAQGFRRGISRLLEGAILIRSTDDDSAASLLTRILSAPNSTMAPPRVPDSTCAEVETTGQLDQFVCALRYRRYVGYVWGTQLQDAQQRAAAQYALLANAQ